MATKANPKGDKAATATAKKASAKAAPAPPNARTTDPTAAIENATGTAAKKAEAANSSGRMNDIPKSSLTSPVTSDLPGEGEDTAAQNEAFENLPPEVKAGLGLVKVDGIDFRYVGVAPAQDQDAETPSGLKITPDNSVFTPLGNVPFSQSIRVKDPKSGEFYFPQDGITSWAQCELNGNKLFE
jgi:hypothetical protein